MELNISSAINLFGKGHWFGKYSSPWQLKASEIRKDDLEENYEIFAGMAGWSDLNRNVNQRTEWNSDWLGKSLVRWLVLERLLPLLFDKHQQKFDKKHTWLN